jgi:hypothetical protein
MYINLSTLIPVGVGVKVPAGSLLNSQATQLIIDTIPNIHIIMLRYVRILVLIYSDLNFKLTVLW